MQCSAEPLLALALALALTVALTEKPYVFYFMYTISVGDAQYGNSNKMNRFSLVKINSPPPYHSIVQFTCSMTLIGQQVQ